MLLVSWQVEQAHRVANSFLGHDNIEDAEILHEPVADKDAAGIDQEPQLEIRALQ